MMRCEDERRIISIAVLNTSHEKVELANIVAIISWESVYRIEIYRRFLGKKGRRMPSITK